MRIHPRHHPRLVGTGELRQMLEYDVANGVGVERPAKRLTERHEPFQFRRVRLRLHGVDLRGGYLPLGLLPLALLMEEKDDNQNEEGWNERQAGGLLDLAGEGDKVSNRPLGWPPPHEQDNQGEGEASQQRAVPATDWIHGIGSTLAETEGTVK